MPPDSPGSTDSTSKDNTSVFSRLRPMTRRLSAALRDADIRHTRARSQSNECMFSVNREDADFTNGIVKKQFFLFKKNYF